MEKMKINSKVGYGRARVKSGYGPHRMLEMLQQTKLGKLGKRESQKKGSDSRSMDYEIITSHHKLTEVKE